MACSYWCGASSSATFRGLSMANPFPLPSPSLSSQYAPTLQFSSFVNRTTNMELNRRTVIMKNRQNLIQCCSDSASESESESESDYDSDTSTSSTAESTAAATPLLTTATMSNAPPMVKKRRRYRKQYPGEKKGITEEMRFVAMRLRNVKGKKIGSDASDEDEDGDENVDSDRPILSSNDGESDAGSKETWQPSMEGFLKYLVDSQLIFNTIERIVDESGDVSYAYFRKTGLERSKCLSRDLEWFSQQDAVIPPVSNPGITYAKYLKELAEISGPLFLSHFYNIYFSHIAGGQVISKQVSKTLLEGRDLEFYTWDGDETELLKGVRDKLNMLGEHWSRDERNKALREATKSFRYMGQIVRLIIL